MIKKIIKKVIKLVIFIVISSIFYTFVSSCSVVLSNRMALQQFQDDDSSFIIYQFQPYLLNAAIAIIIVVFLILFWKDIINAIKFIAQKYRNDIKY